MIFDIFYGKHGVMQPVASFEAIHLNGTKSQAAIHGAVTETMIGTNAPTRIKTTSGYRSVRPISGIARI
jgi:hypothetical protein